MKPVARISSRVLASFSAFIAVASMMPLAAQTAVAQTRVAQTTAPKGDTILGTDDVIEVMVTNHPDLNKTLTVGPDGKVTMVRAGEIQAAGKTARALAAEIEARLSRTLNNARVTVAIKEVNSRRVRIVGAIKVAGSYELKPNWRFMDVVAMAGGLSTKTTRISGRVIRSGNVIPLNVEQAAAKPADSANLLLKPNDLVMLDERDITKQINVIGQVRTPGAFDLTEDLNIITLVNQAGGPTEKAALRKAYVQRAGSVIDIDLYNTLMEGGVDSSTAKFKFEPGDVLVVPENDARFTVTGHVATPGLYPLPEKKDAATVLKALVAAGNQTADADLSGASLTRIVDGQPTVIPVNIADMLTGKRADDVILQPGDLLYIPKANRQLTVSGKVAKPGVYEIKEGQSLISLIAEAGGTAEGAALRSAYIMRNGQQLPVDLYPALVEGKSDVTVNDLAFRPGDVLVIPENRVRYAVLGQVASPNYYSYPENRREATLLKALSAAGGPVRESNLTRVGIIRTVNGQPTVTEVNVQDMLSKGALGSNVLLQPEDIVYIPAKTKGFSWGTILQPLGALRMILGGGIF